MATRKRFSAALKQQAIDLAGEIGTAQAARKLGIGYHNLRNWANGVGVSQMMRAAKKGSPQQFEGLDERLGRVESENKRLRKWIIEHALDVLLGEVGK